MAVAGIVVVGIVVVEAAVGGVVKQIPTHLLLQWHITDRCNLRCSHCYQTDYHSAELNFPQLLAILTEFKALLTTFQYQANRKIPGHITVTGGEPFLRRDFLNLLEVFSVHRPYFSFAILTNGSLIDIQMAKRLRRLRPNFIQVSLEGAEATHDKIRGSGDFVRTIDAIKNLRRVGIRTLIAFTAHRDNFREFPAIVQLGQRLGVNRIWADRLIPSGQGAKLQALTPVETQTFFHLMYKARLQTKSAWFKRIEVPMHRALQFLVADGHPYHCTAGDSLLTIQPNGDLYPCRRMPIRVGNVLETSLTELYEHSVLLNALRDPQCMSTGCEKCLYVKVCRGGLKCLAYALTGDPFTIDPGCWLKPSIHNKSITV